ncbi:DUF4142 domain-containing protein [Bdellovibrio sp. BCCA]|uniref:DUF4142 domain-containing protein n=1 Tax=Bdellovibrio sp. BCCA TaxID=3136281 RepID=UPI0030F2F46B
MNLFRAVLASLVIVFSAVHAWALSDSEIAEVLMTANEAEIDAGKVAKSKAADKTVKDFAEHMVSEHEENKKEGKKITKDEKISTKSNDTAKDLKKDAKEKLSDLKKRKGKDFDLAYIQNQINMHQQLLTDLEQKYIPQAQNPQFKNFLNETKTHVEQHLAKAKEVEATLTK